MVLIETSLGTITISTSELVFGTRHTCSLLPKAMEARRLTIVSRAPASSCHKRDRAISLEQGLGMDKI